MVFGPLRRSEQRGLLTIPEAINDGARWLPALLQQLAERSRFFELRACAGERVLGTIDPGVVMIAANDPLVREFRAGDARDDVIEGFAIPVETDGQVRLRRARPNVIGQGQSAAPCFGNCFATEGLQERSRVRIGDGENRNLRDGLHLIDRNQLHAFDGADSGGLRIAGVDGHVHHAAALRTIRRTHRTLGIGVALVVAIFARIGVNDAADGSVLGGNFGLDAAPARAVARDDNGAFDGDAHTVEDIVVFGAAVVHIDQRRSYIAVA